MLGGQETSPETHIVGTVAADGTDVQALVSAGAGGILVALGAEELDVAASQAECANGALVPEPTANAGLVRDCQVLPGLRDTLFGKDGPISNWNPITPMVQWVG